MSISSQSQSASAVLTAIICAGVVTAQFVGGKAARDALFLAQIDVTSLPAMVIATSIFSIALVAVNAKGVSRLSPARFVPWAFAVSAVLLIAEWLLTFSSPKLAAVLVYLHISGLGPILGSGFWLVATERFDPRTAKRKFGQIAAGGTFGGLLGGLLAERVAVMFGVSAMLPVLAILNLVCAWQVRRLVPAPTSQPQSKEFSAELTPEPAWSGVRVLAETPYLRHLALLVLLGTASAALIDYVFKAQAVAALGTGESLLRFFGVYYAIVSLVTFAVQTSTSRFALERLGLAFTSATPSIALFAGGLGALARRDSKARLSRAARNRCSAVRCSGRATRCSIPRFPRPRSARRNRSSTSASIAWAMRSAAAPCASCSCSRRRCNIPRSCS